MEDFFQAANGIKAGVEALGEFLRSILVPGKNGALTYEMLEN